VLIHQTPRDCVILDADEPGTCELTRDARARVLWCRTTGALEQGVYVAKNRIAARLNGHVEEICPIGELPRGVLRAALVAVACALWVGMSPEAIASVLAPGKSGTAPFLAARGRLRSVTTAERAGEARAPASSTVTA
jgi:UDP-N-acetylmuramoylalanine-D-glutamate ligase